MTRMVEVQSKNILLVDDEAIIAMAGKSALERNGYNVVIVHSGERAIEITRSTPDLDLVLMDINLGPGIDGTRAAEKILQEREIPIVFVSSHTEPEVVAKTEGITSYGYVVKNSGEMILLASIRMAFRLFEAHCNERRNQDQLQSLESRHSALLDAIPDMMFLLDGDGTYLDCHTQSPQDLYVDPATFLGRRVRDVLPGDLAQTTMEHISRAVRTGEQQIYTYSLETGTGQSCFENRLVPCGKNEILSIVRNVTEQHRAVTATETRERYLAAILATMRDGFWTIDQEGRILEVNQAYCDMSGYSREEVLSRQITDFDTDKSGQQIAARIAEVIELGSTRFETHHRRKDGSVFDVEVSAGWMGESYRTLIVFCRDISRRKHNQLALEQSRQRWQFALEGAEQGLWDWDAATNSVYYSRQWKRMLGYDDTDVGVSFDDWDSRIHPDDREQTYAQLEHHTNGRSSVYVSEHRLRCKDGSYKWILDRGKVIERTGDGRPKRIIGTHTDITARKRAEQQIERLLTEKELLLRESHHRIKNNMGVINGLLLLQAGNLGDRASADALYDAAGRVQSMMVLYDKLYRSDYQHELSVKEYLPPMVQMIVELLSTKSAVQATVDAQDIVMSTTVLSPIGIMINELITNSIKHAFADRADARIFITVRCNGDHNILTYSDNGIGLPSTVSFHDTATFGLTLIRLLVDQIGGTIQVNSDHGTQVEVTFPA